MYHGTTCMMHTDMLLLLLLLVVVMATPCWTKSPACTAVSCSTMPPCN
jgi:hypothetical protein